MYTITLADGTKITDLELNGTNYVSQTEIDENVFKDNLSTITISDGETETVYEDMVFIQQMKMSDGTYYLAFREKFPEEKIAEAIVANASSVTDVEMAITEIYEMILGGI